MKTSIGLRFAKLFKTTITASFLMLIACEGPQGEIGPAGKDGLNGTNGKDGNANVIQVTFNETYRVISPKVLTFPSSITTDILNNSAILVYITPTLLPSIYQIPGLVLSDTFRYVLVPSSRSITISNETKSFATEIKLTRIVLIPANIIINGRVALPNIDLSDYEAVKRYYNLKD